MVAGDRPATLQPQEDFPTNRGGLCSKGWTAADLLDHQDRLLTPLVRAVPGDRTSPLRPASWTEALDRVADGIRLAQDLYGPDGVGVFGGGGLTNEKAYTLGKFARVALKTSAIDYNGRFCMSSSATAGNRAFGVDRGLPFPLSDIAERGGDPAGRGQPGGHHAAGDAVLRRGPGGRRPAHRGRSAAHLHRGRCQHAPRADSRHRPGAGQRFAAHRHPRRLPRRGLHRRADDRFRIGAGPPSRPTGRTGWNGSPGSAWPNSGRRCASWRRRRRR